MEWAKEGTTLLPSGAAFLLPGKKACVGNHEFWKISREENDKDLQSHVVTQERTLLSHLHQ